jgi:hypothetical protein
MRKQLSLPVLLLFITACAPAFPKPIEPSKTLDVGLAAEAELSSTPEMEEHFNPIPSEPTETIAPSRLLPSSELQSYCLPWLDESPSPSSSIRLENGIMEGDSAVDFSLNDVHGETHRLSDLLETKPVLLILGGYT